MLVTLLVSTTEVVQQLGKFHIHRIKQLVEVTLQVINHSVCPMLHNASRNFRIWGIYFIIRNFTCLNSVHL